MKRLWESGRNPYRFNYYGRLGIGVDTTRRIMQKRNADLCARIKSGSPVLLDGVDLSEREIQEAFARLGEVPDRIAEVILVHGKGNKGKGELQAITTELMAATAVPEGPIPLRLCHPAIAFWFVPPPGAEMVPMPRTSELGLVAAGDPDDLDLDIVFDE